MSEEQVKYEVRSPKSEVPEQAHHPLGMSKWPALAQCPWFEGGGERPASPYAEEGTEAHRLLAEAMRGNPCPVKSPHYEAVSWAAEVLKGIENHYGTKFDIERRVEITRDKPDYLKGIFGTCDYCMVLPDRIIVADFKAFGNGEKCHVEQLAGYAYALHCENQIHNASMMCELIILHGAIKQHDLHIISSTDCREMSKTVIKDVHNRKETDRATNDRCQYCRHYPCEETAQVIKAVAPDAIPTLIATREELLANPARIPTALALIEDFEKHIKRFVENAGEAIKAHGAHTVDKLGYECWTLTDPSNGAAYEIRQTQGSRRFADILTVWEECNEMGVGSDQFLKCCTVKIGDIKKTAHAASGLTLKEVDRRLDALAERGEVRETLKRVK